jgi:hypothetical protein
MKRPAVAFAMRGSPNRQIFERINATGVFLCIYIGQGSQGRCQIAFVERSEST